jgi:hypothetical protein
MRLHVVIIALQLAASSVCAGAWLKDPGEGFNSLAMVAQNTPFGLVTEGRVFLEYGLTDRLTVGLNAIAQQSGDGEVLAFARLPLRSEEQAHRLAIELGLGAQKDQGVWSGLSKVTLSYGRGFENRWGYGWFSVDAALEYREVQNDIPLKVDVTVGQSSGMRWRPILQVETQTSRRGGTSWTIAPGVMRDGPNGTTFVVQAERHSDHRYGLRLGLWRSF